ncbi:MAG TPA: alpha/beta hydrolase [Caulobacteraceae bacterium]|nr:alpha/beta hydrolase [Caulobacteraceae bacterium]
MNVEIHGDGTWPHLLLVHGLLSSRAQWRPNLAALSAVSTPVVVELLGHGRSSSPTDPESHRVAAYVRRFEALRERLGVERWFVCGQSFGAGLTIRYALEHPERIIGQVFTNTMSGLSPAMREQLPERRARVDAVAQGGREALKALPFHPRPSKRLPREVWEDLVADAELLSPPAVAEALRTTTRELSVADDLRRISVPTLLVNGRRESAFQPLRDLAAREIPSLTVVDLDGGHSVNLDQAEAFNAAVANFIRLYAASPRWVSNQSSASFSAGS